MMDYMPLKAAAMLAILAKAESQAATLQQSPCELLQTTAPMLFMMPAYVHKRRAHTSAAQHRNLHGMVVQQRIDCCHSITSRS